MDRFVYPDSEIRFTAKGAKGAKKRDRVIKLETNHSSAFSAPLQ
jgi:hypothetical protein